MMDLNLHFDSYSLFLTILLGLNKKINFALDYFKNF